MIKAVLFDYGGVVTPTAVYRLSEQLGHSLGITQEQAWAILEPVLNEYMRGTIDQVGVQAMIERAYGKSVEAKACEIWNGWENMHPLPEIVGLAKRLRDNGLIVGLLTNVVPYTMEAIRSHGGYDGFDPVIASCEVGFIKPDEAIYRLAIDRLHLQPEAILFVDDSAKNLVPANKLGMHTTLAEEPGQIVRDVIAMTEQENRVL